MIAPCRRCRHLAPRTLPAHLRLRNVLLSQQEYAEFMSEVETGTAQAATVQAAEEEDEAGERERREEFENL